MLPDRVLNPEPLAYESGALPIALRGPARAAKSCDKDPGEFDKHINKSIIQINKTL